MGRPKTKIEVYATHDSDENICYTLGKEKGKLKLDEVIKALREYESGYYLLLIDCFHEDDEPQYLDVPSGDQLTAYPAEDLFKKHNSKNKAAEIENIIDDYYKEKYKNE